MPFLVFSKLYLFVVIIVLYIYNMESESDWSALTSKSNLPLKSYFCYNLSEYYDIYHVVSYLIYILVYRIQSYIIYIISHIVNT